VVTASRTASAIEVRSRPQHLRPTVLPQSACPGATDFSL
jgi:hypothetical protein